MDNSMIFMNACRNGQKGVVQALVKKGGLDFDKRDAAGNTSLFYACTKGVRDIVQILLDGGADPCLANNASMVPLHAVAQNGNKEIIAMLVKAGADINSADRDGKTPLIHALCAKRTESAKYLIEEGADISMADNDGHRALDYATANGLRDIIALLSGDGDGNADTFGNTPLHQACYNGQSEVVRELINISELNAVNDNGETPLLLACINGRLNVLNSVS